MNAYEIAEVIAEYLVDNKDLTIAMIKDNDKETLQDEIYAELTEEIRGAAVMHQWRKKCMQFSVQ